MTKKKHITGIVLAGGKSTRMGRDKGFVLLNDKPFINHVIDALTPFVDTLIIVSNNPAYDVFKLKRVEDIFKDSGPLAGLYSGLYHSKTENNIVLSCDVPLINNSVLNELIKEIGSDTEVVMVKSEGRKMPLVACYKKQTMAHFLSQLQKGKRGLFDAIKPLNVKIIALAPALAKHVKNINTSTQLNQIKHEYYS